MDSIDPIDTLDTMSSLAHPLLYKEDIHPLIYLEVFSKKYGNSWLEWEPETLWETLSQDYGIEPSRLIKDKINAVKLIKINNSFFRDWAVFENASLALNGVLPLFDISQDLSPAQMAFGIILSSRIDKSQEFDNEVRGYIAARLINYGIMFAVYPLDIAQEKLNLLLRAEQLKLKEKIRVAFKKIEDKDPNEIEIPGDEDPINVHLAKIVGVKMYLKEKELDLIKQRGSYGN